MHTNGIYSIRIYTTKIFSIKKVLFYVALNVWKKFDNRFYGKLIGNLFIIDIKHPKNSGLKCVFGHGFTNNEVQDLM